MYRNVMNQRVEVLQEWFDLKFLWMFNCCDSRWTADAALCEELQPFLLTQEYTGCLPSSSVISWRPKDPRFGWGSSGSSLMLSTSLGLESRVSFWGPAGVTQALLGLDGEGSL